MNPNPSITLSDANFDSEVLQADEPTLVEFWAPWSKACTESASAADVVDPRADSPVRAVRLNVDDNPQTAVNYSVIRLPTFILFTDATAVARTSGAVSPRHLARLLDESSGPGNFRGQVAG